MSSEQSACPVKKPPVSKCPVNHKKPGTAENSSSEPPDTVDHFMIRNAPHSVSKVIENRDSKDPNDIVPGMAIPATGRGNSENGENWLNPSANQLFHALQRKDKPIEYKDALSVAHIHSIVTTQTWDEIMKYESYHFNKCKEPKLARFEGKDGFYSPKARFFNRFFQTPLPYDRHDWTVDRCGKEVEYVIDYYAIPFHIDLDKNDENENENDNRNINNEIINKHSANNNNNSNKSEDSIPFNVNSIEYKGKKEKSTMNDKSSNNHIDDDDIEYFYTIDARPKLNSFGNAFDRLRMGFSLWWQGESWM